MNKIQMAAKLYDARDSMKLIFKDEYPVKIAAYRRYIEAAMKKSEGKCISCYFYKYENGYWVSGYCSNKLAKIKRTLRYYNDKICKCYRRPQ